MNFERYNNMMPAAVTGDCIAVLETLDGALKFKNLGPFKNVRLAPIMVVPILRPAYHFDGVPPPLSADDPRPPKERRYDLVNLYEEDGIHWAEYRESLR